jgi:hypothetical protein
MNHAVRAGLVTASLLASFAGLAASPASGEDLARPVDPAWAAPRSLEPSVSEEKRHPRPAPPLATFTGVATLGRKRYPYTLVGSNPQVRRARNVVVPALIVPIRLQFSNGTVLDPSQPDSCLEGLAPLAVTLQSPLFQDFDYGDGPRQFLEHIRRLEFWRFAAPGKLNPGYSVRLAPSVLPTQTLALGANSATEEVACLSTHGGLHTMGHVDLQEWNSFLYQLAPQFSKLGVSPSTFVVFLFSQIDLTSEGTPIQAAFHDVFPAPQGMITYAVSGYGVIREGNVVNLGALSHELAEWLDDPFVNNLTPPWGHIGPVTGCFPGLEVGDPLVGTFLPAVQMPNGITYQLQETAFLSWFFDQVPSLGFDGWYSTGGTFKSPAAPCP